MTISSWFPSTPSQICLDDPPYNNKQPFHFLVVDEDFQKHHKIQRANLTQINVRSELAGPTQNTDLNKAEVTRSMPHDHPKVLTPVELLPLPCLECIGNFPTATTYSQPPRLEEVVYGVMAWGKGRSCAEFVAIIGTSTPFIPCFDPSIALLLLAFAYR